MNRLIPLSIIYEAMNGDEIAIAAVISHYRGYIRFLSQRSCRDALGFEHLYVDEDMQRRLEAKLIYAIVTGFKVLSD
ncbi:MAG: helix-turn-helix domain-containing protein [Oscillospiraceae bacterium]|nr:helix-turn-helix domain-containing protein [Oscillospiraceae bacterium]